MREAAPNAQDDAIEARLRSSAGTIRLNYRRAYDVSRGSLVAGVVALLFAGPVAWVCGLGAYYAVWGGYGSGYGVLFCLFAGAPLLLLSLVACFIATRCGGRSRKCALIALAAIALSVLVFSLAVGYRVRHNVGSEWRRLHPNE